MTDASLQALSGDGANDPDGQARVESHAPRTISERIADSAAAGIGSWRFIIIQTFLVVLWVALNIIGFAFRWDPYPFILLNLMFSVQAAYTGPILLLASNRQASIDRAIAARDDEEIGMLLALQREQMDILTLLKQTADTQVRILEMLQPARR